MCNFEASGTDFFNYMSLFVYEIHQSFCFMNHQNIRSKNLDLDIEIFSWSTCVIVQQVLVFYQETFFLKINFPPHILRNNWRICVFQSLFFCILPYASLCVTWKFYFWLTPVFARFIRAVVKVSPSVKFIL